ncbi:PAS domain S-box protein [Paenibacillus planticolens]|uniref:histidine kinase n=1 Tax=Paenibacillus planticolens TaxID=2654976 RepID=A0ABX1ZJP0_9BACL|nr:PAS domain S-box protein [Paenibacillus planticolens]NOV00041.1 PAS domain S-box protein [Paenibacillus planticolens]
MANHRFETFRLSRSLKSEKATIEHEWEKFMSGSFSQLNVRTSMHQSWQRCMEQGVHPLLSKASNNLGIDQIQEYVTSDPLFQMVEPFLKKLKQLAANTGYLVTYSNAAGEMIYFDGDMSLMLKAEDINFSPGSDWSEGSAGTNAIGTALATGVPIQVFASEHFCQEIHGWTCSAAPIHDPATGKVLGVIDLTSFWTVFEPESLDAVVMVAQDIENMLYSQLKFERFRLSQYFVEQTKRTTLPLAVLDRGGRVIKASQLLYKKGWISPDHCFDHTSFIKESFPSKTNWELKDDNKLWLFELSPYFYGGVAIGSIVNVLPPDIAVFNYLPDFRQFPASSSPLSKNDAVESQKRVSKQDQFYKSLFEHHPDAIFTYDLQGILLDANPAAERMLGYDASELRNIMVEDFTFPDYIEQKLRAFANSVRGKQQEYDTAFRHKQGHSLLVSVKSFPIIVENEIVGVYEAVRDIAPHHQQISEDLKSTKEQLEFYFGNTEDAVLVVNANLHIVKANRSFERIYGWTEQELLGKMNPTIPDHLMWELDEIRNNMFSSRQVIPYETVRQRKDGSLINVSNYASPLFDSKGNTVAYVLISRDITGLKQTEELLRKTEKLAVVGQLAAGIAHEIRNPLTTLKGFLTLLKSQTTDKDGWYLDVMLTEIEQMEWIANQFLTVAKPQIVKFERRKLGDVVQQVASFLYPLATMHNVQILIASESEDRFIECDENQLKQVFINVVKNAIEAMPHGGQIDIMIKYNKDSVAVRVKDQGYGIPQDRIAHLGEPFFSLKEKGTGLGLMVCYKIIKEHHGTIHIESEVGRGTTVEINLPFK